MPTIASQIESLENQIKQCEERLDSIDRSLRLEEITESKRQSLHEEDKRLKKQILSHEKELKELRKENWKSMLFSVLLMGLIYICYYQFWSP